MAWDFHVGQKVVCVDASAARTDGIVELEEGRIYTIRSVGPFAYKTRSKATDCAIWLAEIVRPIYPGWEADGEVPFNASRFRPLVTRKSDISIFKALLTPQKQREDA